jgi:hypothetical protein
LAAAAVVSAQTLRRRRAKASIAGRSSEIV